MELPYNFVKEQMVNLFIKLGAHQWIFAESAMFYQRLLEQPFHRMFVTFSKTDQ
jgi:hypothetical protein